MIGFAWFMLFLWPVVALVFYKRLSLPMALCLTVLVGYILLPNRIGLNLPMIPTLNKPNIFAASALVLTAIFAAQKQRDLVVLQGWVPRDSLTRILLVVFFLGFFATAHTNGDSLAFTDHFIPGLTLYDGASQALQFFLVITPFFLARKVLASPEAQRVLLLVLALTGLIYTLPALWEVRMSPHLQRSIYGIDLTSFLHYARSGGFRPTVFMGNGLELGIYTVFSVLAAACLLRISTDKSRMLWLCALVWLIFALLLYKTLGAFLIMLVLLPCVLMLNPRTQLLVATCIAVVMMTYPVLRASHIIPIDRALSVAQQISPARAVSLNTRFLSEEMLLEKAAQRPLFGWGDWGRSRVFTETGRDISITDGGWILQLGAGGWLRYLSLFGLLCWPIIKLFIAYRKQVDPVMAAMVLILCAKLVDLIPNSGFIPVIWLIAGSLLGRMELLAQSGEVRQENALQRPTLGYARRFPESEARRAAREEEAQDTPAPLSYKRPLPGAGYRK